MSYKLVIAVRTDLKLSKGKLAVQVAHASILCANKVKKKILNEWLKYGQKKIVVKLKNLDELFELEKNAKEKDITCEVVADAGLTELPPGTITCIGIGPDKEDIIDEITGKLKLV